MLGFGMAVAIDHVLNRLSGWPRPSRTRCDRPVERVISRCGIAPVLVPGPDQAAADVLEGPAPALLGARRDTGVPAIAIEPLAVTRPSWSNSVV